MKTTRLINNCLIFSFILSLLLSLSSIELRSQDSDFYYELIGELPDYPAEGLWNPGFPQTIEMEIGNCKIKVKVKWGYRMSLDRIPEVHIIRLEVFATSKECSELVPHYRAQITDFVAFKLFDICSQHYGIYFPPCNIFKNEFYKSENTQEAELSVEFFRLFVSTCGNWVRYKHYGMYHFVPCKKTNTFCVMRYKYCWKADINGNFVLVESITPEYDNKYPCPDTETYTDEYGNTQTRQCNDPACSRNPGSFELSSEPYFPIPDIDGNPPVKSDIQLFNK